MINQILNELKENIKQIMIDANVTDDVEIMFEIPKDESHGDYSTNVAMRLAKAMRKAPFVIANEIISKIDLEKHHLSKAEVAGAGFINF